MNSKFMQDLRSTTFSAIARIALSDDRLNWLMFGWGNTSARVLKLLIAEEIITEEELLSALDALLKITGRRSYDQHKRGEYPDHTISPQALAYALQNGQFTEKEKYGIKFDHGDTIQTFIESYNSGDLRRTVLDQLLTEQAPVVHDSDSNGCEGCGCFESH